MSTVRFKCLLELSSIQYNVFQGLYTAEVNCISHQLLVLHAFIINLLLLISHLFSDLRNKPEEALAAFEKQLKYSRTALDCKNTLVMIESIKASKLVKERFGLISGNIMNLGPSGLMGPQF